jgi:hypothetical protein
MSDPRKLVAVVGTFLLVSITILSLIGMYRGGSNNTLMAQVGLGACALSGVWGLWALRNSHRLSSRSH